MAERYRRAVWRRGIAAVHDLNVMALFKGAERFVFVYDDAGRDAMIAALRDAAADPSVALNWFDAAVLTERARRQATDARADSDTDAADEEAARF